MAVVFEDHSEWVKRGKLVTFRIAMDPIPDRRMRTIRVWTPESYDGVRRFPVLYLHDGQVVFPEKANPAMGSWDCELRISELEPELQCMVVAVDTSNDRSNELLPPLKPDLNFGGPRRPDAPKVDPLGGYYADFIRDTLKPIIDANFLTLPDAAHTAVGGASMGGLESLYMTFKDPDVFGRSLDLSCGLGLLEAEDYLARIDAYDPGKLENVRFYLYTGDQGIESRTGSSASLWTAGNPTGAPPGGRSSRTVSVSCSGRTTAWRHRISACRVPGRTEIPSGPCRTCPSIHQTRHPLNGCRVLARLTRLERTTFCSGGRRSIQLSYRRICTSGLRPEVAPQL